MFYGEYQHSFDQKGRIIMPAKLREGLKDKFMVTKGLDNCLYAFDSEEWARLESKMRELPLTDKDVRDFMRFFFSGACECEFDKQGRISIPPYLRDYAGLTKETLILGVSSRVEIWSTENLEKNTLTSAPNDLAEKMALLGI